MPYSVEDSMGYVIETYKSLEELQKEQGMMDENGMLPNGNIVIVHDPHCTCNLCMVEFIDRQNQAIEEE